MTELAYTLFDQIYPNDRDSQKTDQLQLKKVFPFLDKSRKVAS